MITFSHVEPIFKACNQCHVNKSDAPNLSQYPFGYDRSGNHLTLEFVAWAIDWKNSGASRTMPPGNAGWSLSPDDFSILKLWISQGARDDEGQVYLGQSEIDQLVPKEQQLQRRAYRATFDDTYFRFLSGFDFKLTIQNLIPSYYTERIVVNDFRELGFKDPVTGLPFLSGPNAATIATIALETNSFISTWLNEDSKRYAEFGFQYAEIYGAWKDLEKSRQTETLGKAMLFFIGPDVLDKKNYEKMFAMLREKVNQIAVKNPNLTVNEAILKISFLLITSEKFQTI